MEDCLEVIDMLMLRFQQDMDKGPSKQKLLQQFDNEQIVKSLPFLYYVPVEEPTISGITGSILQRSLASTNATAAYIGLANDVRFIGNRV